MVSDWVVATYKIVNKKLGLRGGGWLIRTMSHIVPGLRSYPLHFQEWGKARVDLQDGSTLVLLDYSWGDLGTAKHLVHYMTKCLRPGDCLWDVGANVGVVSLHFCNPRYQLSRIDAFEPNPPIGDVLSTLLRPHQIAKVHLLGLGDKDDQLELNMPSKGSSMASLVQQFVNGQDVTIQVRQGDSYRRALGAPIPDVIKVDVEGFEPQVIAGISDMILQRRPVIFFEHLFLSDSQTTELIPPGYLVRFILDDGSLNSDYARRMEGHDAILLPQEKSAMLER